MFNPDTGEKWYKRNPFLDKILLMGLEWEHYAMLMRPNKAKTAVHGCHCPGDMAVRMR